MARKAALFALGRVKKAPDPLPKDLELDLYLQRHLTGDRGSYSRYNRNELRAIRFGGSAVSLYPTYHGLLLIRTAKSPVDEQVETWCYLLPRG